MPIVFAQVHYPVALQEDQRAGAVGSRRSGRAGDLVRLRGADGHLVGGQRAAYQGSHAVLNLYLDDLGSIQTIVLDRVSYSPSFPKYAINAQ